MGRDLPLPTTIELVPLYGVPLWILVAVWERWWVVPESKSQESVDAREGATIMVWAGGVGPVWEVDEAGARGPW